MTCPVQTAFASNKDKTPPPPVDERILIESVDTSAGMIVLRYMRDGTTHTYALDSVSVIKVGDANSDPVAISDIKAGMQVRDYVERDDHTLDSLLVSEADRAPEAPKKK